MPAMKLARLKQLLAIIGNAAQFRGTSYGADSKNRVIGGIQLPAGTPMYDTLALIRRHAKQFFHAVTIIGKQDGQGNRGYVIIVHDSLLRLGHLAGRLRTLEMRSRVITPKRTHENELEAFGRPEVFPLNIWFADERNREISSRASKEWKTCLTFEQICEGLQEALTENAAFYEAYLRSLNKLPKPRSRDRRLQEIRQQASA